MFCITADHGNCDDMVQRDKKTKQPMRDENGALMPLTSHTLAPVRGAPTGEWGRGGGGDGQLLASREPGIHAHTQRSREAVLRAFRWEGRVARGLTEANSASAVVAVVVRWSALLCLMCRHLTFPLPFLPHLAEWSIHHSSSPFLLCFAAFLLFGPSLLSSAPSPSPPGAHRHWGPRAACHPALPPGHAQGGARQRDRHLHEPAGLRGARGLRADAAGGG